MVIMTGSHSMQYIGLLLLAAILLQTIAVAVTFIYFSNVLSTVRIINLLLHVNADALQSFSDRFVATGM